MSYKTGQTYFYYLNGRNIELYQRSDDNRGTILRRMQVYENETVPLKEFYEKEGNLKTIPGHGTVEEIFSRMCALVS